MGKLRKLVAAAGCSSAVVALVMVAGAGVKW